MWHQDDCYIAETKCKTWSCNSCRQNLLTLVEMKIEYGCLMLGPCVFTTLTYVNTGPESLRHAGSVRLDWELFLRKLKLEFPSLSWFKVPEVTKKGQVHLHLVMGGLAFQGVIQCETNPKNWKVWFRKECECLAHKFIRQWYERTGAYVINVQEVYNPTGLGAYFSKYLTKAFNTRERLESLGFVRRYACSRNWPRGAKLELRGTLDKSWDRVVRVARNASNFRYFTNRIEQQREGGPMAQVGDSYAFALADRRILRARRSRLKKMERLVHDNSISPHN